MRLFRRSLGFWTALFTLTWWCSIQVAPAFAGLVPSRVSGTTAIASSRDADVLTVQRALEHKVVVQKLRDYGVAPAEADARLASMSDQDLHTLASYSKGLPSGSDDSLIALLIVILLVILILKALNKQVVIK
jgi:hypothetical protein